MSSFFVFGATGYTGRQVVSKLLTRGVKTHAHVRPNRLFDDQEWRCAGTTIHRTEWSAEAMAENLSSVKPSVVFALLGTTRSRAKKEGIASATRYMDVDYSLTAMLLQACIKSCPETHFVYLSSLGVTQSTSNAYLQARARVEAELAASSLLHSIARPSFISGSDRPESRPGERAAATASDGVLAALAAFGAKKLRDKYSSMTGATLAQALVKLAIERPAASQTIEAADLRQLARSVDSLR